MNNEVTSKENSKQRRLKPYGETTTTGSLDLFVFLQELTKSLSKYIAHGLNNKVFVNTSGK
jgi:hypothetical protein